jgi:hypothetical protein
VVGVVDDDFVELAEAIAVLRTQLHTAQQARLDGDPRFVVGKVEVELAVEARRDASGEAGIQFGVFTLKGKGGGSSASTHRVKLELTPLDASGAAFEVHSDVAEPPSR